MRITCPNCGAQYEVDDTLIPEAGRDVQCSNCGKGWFQARNPEPEETFEDEPVAAETPEEIAVEDTVMRRDGGGARRGGRGPSDGPEARRPRPVAEDTPHPPC